MAILRFLHLTDLHIGHKGGNRWPHHKKRFLDDLAYTSDRCGAIDLVMFTGDLVQSGIDAEFVEAEAELEEVRERLKTLGSQPLLLIVPGNHDLVRPDRLDIHLTLLEHWTTDDARRREYWTTTKYASIRHMPFQPYLTHIPRILAHWNGVAGLKEALAINDSGNIPGEFRATLRVHGKKLGILGLNTAYLHLLDEVQGKLDLDRDNVQSVAGGNLVSWCRSHDLNVLLTHHPKDWLHAKARQILNAELVNGEQFKLHFFGHMHEPAAKHYSENGGPWVAELQGRSLFGLERWQSLAAQEERLAGYAASLLKVDADAAIESWPRLAFETAKWKIGADGAFALDPFTQSYVLPPGGERLDSAWLPRERILQRDKAEWVSTLQLPWSPDVVGDIQAAIKKADQVDLIVAHGFNQVLRRADVAAFFERSPRRLRIAMQNYADDELLDILIRKFGSGDPSKKDSDRATLRTKLTDSLKGLFGACSVDYSGGSLRVSGTPADSRNCCELYTTSQRITMSYYRVDDTLWLVPLWMTKAKDPPPCVFLFQRVEHPATFSAFEHHFEKLVEESQAVTVS